MIAGKLLLPILLGTVIAAGCAEAPRKDPTRYGTMSGTEAHQADRRGTIFIASLRRICLAA